jgi:hypothetical protein
MVGIGEPTFRNVTLAVNASQTVFASTGEAEKITMVYGRTASNGNADNVFLRVAPDAPAVSGNGGTATGNAEEPPVGANTESGLQPVLIDDQRGLNIRNDRGSNDPQDDIVVIIRGIRVA